MTRSPDTTAVNAALTAMPSVSTTSDSDSSPISPGSSFAGNSTARVTDGVTAEAEVRVVCCVETVAAEKAKGTEAEEGEAGAAGEWGAVCPMRLWLWGAGGGGGGAGPPWTGFWWATGGGGGGGV